MNYPYEDEDYCLNCGEYPDQCDCLHLKKQEQEDWQESVIEDKLQRRMADEP